MKTRRDLLVEADKRCDDAFTQYVHTVMHCSATDEEKTNIIHHARIHLTALREMLRITFTGV